jgi:phosphoenolpyruvate carboxykinase (ATP)
MPQSAVSPTGHDLREYGFRNIQVIHWNQGSAQLVESAVQREEGNLAANGALVVRTGQFTGRSPKDKYIVREPGTEAGVNWGPVNQAMSPESFDRMYTRLQAYLENQKLYIQDCFGGADPEYTLPVRVITVKAWHALFARQLFIRRSTEGEHHPEFTLIFAPGFRANPAEDGTRSETCIVINFARRLVLIAGTMYAGEMKKSVFTILK